MQLFAICKLLNGVISLLTIGYISLNAEYYLANKVAKIRGSKFNKD